MPVAEAQRPAIEEPQQEVVDIQAVVENFPINRVKEAFVRSLVQSDRVALIGPPGSGKTTLAPLFILDVVSQNNPKARVIVTQPRKIAVDSVAQRVGETIGEGIVGYRYKNAYRVTDRTRIAFMVDGSLVNELKANPTLEGWDAVMIDEIHKESSDMLYVLAILKEAQDLRRRQGKPPLKIVLATGTGNVSDMKAYLPGLLVIEAEGRLKPITKHYLDHEVSSENIVAEAVNIFDKVLEVSPTGDKVVFMPGRSHIRETVNKLKAKYGARVDISFYEVTGGSEDKAISAILKRKAEPGKIRVFVGTDVMQESITIPGVTDSIMSGWKKEVVFDAQTGLSSLRLVPATQIDMIQQAGRAGRDVSGHAWFLMTESQYNGRSASPESEVQRIDLASLVLRIKEQGKDPYTFDFMKKPPKENIGAAIATLQKLDALDASGKISDIGKQIAELPIDPHFARMLIEAKKRGCVEALSVLVGFLSAGKSVFAFNPKRERFDQKYLQYTHPDSDYLTLINVWNEFIRQPNGIHWARQNGFSPSVFEEVIAVRDELFEEEILEGLRVDKSNKPINIKDEKLALAIQQCVVAGFADRILVKGQNDTYVLQNREKGGARVAIAPSSVFLQSRPQAFVSGAIRSQEGEAYAGMNQIVTKEMLQEVAPRVHLPSEEMSLEQEQKAAVEEVERIRRETLARQEISQVKAPPTETEQAVEAEEQKKSFLDKIKQALKNFWTGIKKFFGAR